MKNHLVVFDIDGTLIRAARLGRNLQRFRHAILTVFGKDIGVVTEELWKERNYNGKGDRLILWDMVRPLGIARDLFLDRLGELGAALVSYLEMIQEDGPSYEVIPDAQTMLKKVIAAPHLSLGVLTGNLGAPAIWKLRATGIPEIAFGVYGHEADERNDLARLLIPKATQYFGHEIRAEEIVIVGDTVHDVRCAKAIGARSIVVLTGWNVSRTDVEKENPTLLVDSLLDQRVLELLGLNQ